MSEIIVCPLCGFSFKYSNAKADKGNIKCPMCGHEFRKSSISPFTQKEFEKKF
ncbi:MAG: hypothetical protein ACFFKA_20970 [Candidatus Thorarchaeota archaeon]